MSTDWLIWQLADSAFPTGGFAHSGGLEAAWQLGEVRGAAALADYLRDSLENCGHALLPFVSAAQRGDLTFAELDQCCDATIANHVANRSSRALGQGLLATAVAMAPEIAELKVLKAELRATRGPGHLAPVFGAVCARLDVALLDCQRLFLFLHLRGLISTAVRLGIVGPLEGQAIQRRLAVTGEDVLARCAALTPDDAATTAPLFDCFHGHHDRLYSRLFSS